MLTYPLFHDVLKPLYFWSAALCDGIALLAQSTESATGHE